MLHDASYTHMLQLRGPQEAMLATLAAITPPQALAHLYAWAVDGCNWALKFLPS